VIRRHDYKPWAHNDTHTGNWAGNPEFGYVITGVADWSYKPYHDTAASVVGHAVFLQGAPIAERTKIHNQLHSLLQKPNSTVELNVPSM
jgi:hypothetical protein